MLSDLFSADTDLGSDSDSDPADTEIGNDTEIRTGGGSDADA